MTYSLANAYAIRCSPCRYTRRDGVEQSINETLIGTNSQLLRQLPLESSSIDPARNSSTDTTSNGLDADRKSGHLCDFFMRNRHGSNHKGWDRNEAAAKALDELDDEEFGFGRVDASPAQHDPVPDCANDSTEHDDPFVAAVPVHK